MCQEIYKNIPKQRTLKTAEISAWLEHSDRTRENCGSWDPSQRYQPRKRNQPRLHHQPPPSQAANKRCWTIVEQRKLRVRDEEERRNQ
ncbi:hypothetical protein Pst134EA_011796 [Puccinia striiformis f. sp. tritici]|uniref:hypothetical protein n=1 Tax=Puccinia striiformis f. sp. tritici TaxID=168172 RepID=UPI002007A01D|nr:hypothetical protein Pst134EA_011796 [Puccinia striiformis f. sp. tritici]KAH9468172.1 hypothetical protein Pst134EA_011796 [Puccinia striiformis f. sp. tritici]